MPLPWKTGADTGIADVYVLASSLRMSSARGMLGFMRAASSVRKQLRDADGLVGYSLIGQPHRKMFWTLSAWRDQAALDAFVKAQPHHGIVDQYRPKVSARFASWTMERAELPSERSQGRGLWAEGKARLATADSTGA
jgi:hypothetical protein